MTTKKKPEQIFVGRSERWHFVRVFEEPNGDDLTTGSLRRRKLDEEVYGGFYNLVIGPFRTMKGAEIFRDREGVNRVEEAERLVNA